MYTGVYTPRIYEMEKLVVYLIKDDMTAIHEKKTLCCNGMSDSELGRRAILQYLDIRLALKDKKPGSFYAVYK